MSDGTTKLYITDEAGCADTDFTDESLLRNPVRERILTLIDGEFESDAAFERTLGIRQKTVSNWRRGRSSSYMHHLNEIAALLHVSVGELLDTPISSTSSAELSDDEIKLLTLYRKTRALPVAQRNALSETLCSIIQLYLTSQKGRAQGTHK